MVVLGTPKLVGYPSQFRPDDVNASGLPFWEVTRANLNLNDINASGPPIWEVTRANPRKTVSHGRNHLVSNYRPSEISAIAPPNLVTLAPF